MASYLRSIKSMWLFRSKTNLTLGTLTLCGVGYLMSVIKLQSDIRNPIILDSLNKLARNPQIRQLVGTPISSKGLMSDMTQDDCYFLYHINGPKGSLKAETTAKSRLLKDVYTPNEITVLNQRIERLKGEEKQAEDVLQGLEKRAKEKGDSKTREMARKELQNQTVLLKNIQAELDEARSMKLKFLPQYISSFYIPDKKHIKALEENKESQQQVPMDWKMWSIVNLQVTLPNGNKLILVPSEQQPSKPPMDNVWRFQDLNERLFTIPVDVQHLNKQQLNQYSQIKTSQMYRSIGGYRTMSLLAGTIIAGLIFVYVLKIRMVPINKTLFLRNVQMTFNKHPEVKKMGGKFTWSEMVKGGRKDMEVDAEVDVFSPVTRGVVKIKGYYNSKTDQYTLTDLKFVTSEKTPRIIDLLKP